MNGFKRIQYFYLKGWAKKTQIAMYVVYGVITAAEYETITGEAYEA